VLKVIGRFTVSELDTAIAFPVIPFRERRVDFAAYRKNVRFLVRNCFLDGGRTRVVAIGGSSLLHHLTREERLEAARITCEEAASSARFISGVLPTPLGEAAWLVREQMRFVRPPDAFLILPIVGGHNPEGVYRDLTRFCRELASETGAQFIVYLRDSALLGPLCRLVVESEHVLGIKIGTSEEDVQPACEAVGSRGAVVWGKGDLSTRAVRLGARGHTSGISLVAVRASDEINNAQRRGDYAEAERIEQDLREFEEIRFMQARAWNCSAILEVLRMAAFEDVDPGDGGPFNAPPPAEICARLRALLPRLRPYHSAPPQM
jgi:dihydrodipicolinate synthase/N-acetylneuraminate lyase